MPRKNKKDEVKFAKILLYFLSDAKKAFTPLNFKSGF